MIESVEYEQCHYEEGQVRAIYGRLEDIVADGDWHEFPAHPTSEAWYRVRSGYFQALFRASGDELLAEAKLLEPMETVDDAEWTLEKHGIDEYALRTKFTRTFGMVDEQGRLDKLLEPHGLWLDFGDGSSVDGAATFPVLDAASMQAATVRLKWLEAYCIESNKRMTAQLNEFWKFVADKVEREILESGEPFLRGIGPEVGGRRREAILGPFLKE